MTPMAYLTSHWTSAKTVTSIVLRSWKLAAPMKHAIAGILSIAGLPCAGFLLLSPASGAEFSWQVAGSYRQDDAPRVVESNHSSLSATYYPSPVDDEAGPYELAPFLNRSSYVTIGVARSKLREELIPAIFAVDPSSGAVVPPDVLDLFGEIGFPGLYDIPTESGIDASEYAASGRYVWPGSGWYAGAHSERGDLDSTPAVSFAETIAKHEGSELFAGKYFGSRTAVELGFGTMKQTEQVRARIDSFSSGRFGSVDFQTGVDTERDTENVNLSVRHVGDTGGLTWSVWASVRSSRSETRISVPEPIFGGFPEGLNPTDGLVPLITLSPALPSTEVLQSDRERNYTLSGALFPTDALGVRLVYSRLDRETFGASDLVGLSATWFFVRNAAAEIELLQTNFDRGFGPGARDRDSVRLRLLGRF